MKSRTSFCNKALLKKALQRGLPIWGVYLLAWISFLPMRLITSSDWMRELSMKEYVLSAAVTNSHILPALYGLAAACLVFSYLYKARSANFFAALPMRRETHFTTNYIAGLLYALLPNLIIAVLTLLAGAFNGVLLLKEVLIWYGISAMAYVFFYSFAAFCAMLVGHLAALPLLYGVLNFTVVVIESIVRDLLSTFVYGLYYNGDNSLTFLSPLWHLLGGAMPDVVAVRPDNIVIGYAIEKWEYLAVLFAAGLVLTALAFLLRKGRRMESAGDIIAVNRLKPVFLYCFTFGCSLVIGYVLTAFVVRTSYTNFLPVLICMLVGAFLGFFGGQMMLHKSLRVFRKRYWINFVVICAVITAAMLCGKLDLFGYSRYVPDADDVKAISLDRGDTEYTEDPRLIEMTVALHQDILDQRDEVEYAVNSGYNYQSVYLNYQLNSGKKVLRRYYVPTNSDASANPDSFIRQYEAIYNDPEYLLRKTLPATYGPENISHAIVWHWLNSEIVLSSEKAYYLLKHGIEPDILAGALEYRSWSDGAATVTKEPVYLDIHLELFFERTEDQSWEGQYRSFSFNDQCVNSLKILEEWGIDTTPDQEMTKK